MSVLDIHLRNGQVRMVRNLDRCILSEGNARWMNRDCKLLFELPLKAIDWFEVRHPEPDAQCATVSKDLAPEPGVIPSSSAWPLAR
jgi:hypothetical protein